MYRCRECKARFWAVPRRTWSRLGAAALVVVLALGGSLVFGIYDRLDRGSQPTVSARLPDGIEEYRLSRRYRQGDGVPLSEPEALVWLTRSAHQGYSPAQYELGVALRDGIGITAEPQRAWTWIRLAAEAGEPHAQFELGRMYAEGRDTPIDLTNGYVWLSLAAAKGVDGAAEAQAAVRARMSVDQLARAEAQVARWAETAHPAPATQN